MISMREKQEGYHAGIAQIRDGFNTQNEENKMITAQRLRRTRIRKTRKKI